ncbi:uncharacterized protein LOC100832201 isoform X2 [Brachypodium distachyon]|uniref:uncharacterized protein LOC100832201 isoform X2 n=1 Tax=Brachypodium distachyon TaxID=15368 RepID=UPI000D0DB6AD|nr:uncharacterized protein LOC100832201 isoform X2 [Brachypodium distachyon]|eukprot:XP_024312711.1 uncharacterized protein LOC100832201 isoform X2 [Brachypodium distachyon]
MKSPFGSRAKAKLACPARPDVWNPKKILAIQGELARPGEKILAHEGERDRLVSDGKKTIRAKKKVTAPHGTHDLILNSSYRFLRLPGSSPPSRSLLAWIFDSPLHPNSYSSACLDFRFSSPSRVLLFPGSAPWTWCSPPPPLNRNSRCSNSSPRLGLELKNYTKSVSSSVWNLLRDQLQLAAQSFRWEGSAHDSTVLRHSFEHPNGLRVLEGNNVVWQPQVVKEMLRYYKEKIQAEGRQLVFKETHHEECAKQINAKFSTNFTHRQVYHKFHKLKGQWKVILEAKSLSGANFDDVHKIILYDETEVVRMKNDKDKRAKYINVPISCFDEMESIFQDKHAMGEFTVPQTPFENTCAKDNDFIGDKSATNGEADPGTHYDSDCLPEESNNEGNSSKRATGGKRDKGKRVRRDDVVEDMTRSLRGMSETMRFHACHPPK